MLTNRWNHLRPHPEQMRFARSRARFQVCPAGRRSGKTDIAKRKMLMRAMEADRSDMNFVAGAPTWEQAKRIYWNDLKAMIPRPLVQAMSETELWIRLVNGSTIYVRGMDRPERIEGFPIDGIILDEYASMREEAWTLHVGPALDTPGRDPGWAWFIGVPEGRNHYYDLWADVPRLQKLGEDWDRFHWKSSEILPEATIRAARARTDERTFRQEYEGSFESFEGRAYYGWDEIAIQHCRRLYRPDHPLILMFDFNTSPGIAAIGQEFELRTPAFHGISNRFTAIMDEVWIDEHSRTPLVCDEILGEWATHPSEVRAYGDAAGGNPTSQAVDGSDWDIIDRVMKRAFPDRFSINVPRGNPPVRARLNAVNSRLENTLGIRRLVVDPACEHTVKDFDGTVCDEKGNVLKPVGTKLTHLTDAIGYYLAEVHPTTSGDFFSTEVA